MRKVKSAGILIKSNDKVLLVHATGQKPEMGWGLPKGRVDDGESLTQAAVRETFEECGLSIPEDGLQPLTMTSYNSSDEGERIKKELHVFMFETDESIQQEKLSCSTFFNPHWVKNENVKLPEVDNFKWVEISDVKNVAMKSIKKVFDLL